MRLVLIAAAATLAAACTPAEEVDVMSAGCDARAVGSWNAGEATYSLEATSAGPDCERAVATLIVRDSSGVPIFAEAHLAQHVMMLSHADDTAAMEAALGEWTDVQSQTSAQLPEWAANADSPVSGEFPFYPHEGIDRAQYEAVRASNAPMLCYVQGMESLNCMVLEEGGFASIGLQSFPG